MIGDFRGDYAEVVGAEEGTGSFPAQLVEQLPFDTVRLLWSGWGQPYYGKVLARSEWQEAAEIASQVKRQSDRIVEWYRYSLPSRAPNPKSISPNGSGLHPSR